MNLYTKRNRLTDIQDKLMVLPKGRGRGGGTNLVYEINKLLYIK